MPFRSEKQRRFMWAKHPDIARRWTDKYGSKPQPGPKRTAKRIAKRRKRKLGRH